MKFFMFGFSWTHRSVSVAALILTVILNEYIIYLYQSLTWEDLPVRTRDPQETQVLLLVADPQIQGYQDEPAFPIGTLSRWDADRFLSSTFSLAFAYARPDIVLFLGDLMDEGSQATEAAYKDYLHRFHSIFSVASSTKKIYIPGDNDIGGERRDVRTKGKEDRYMKHFEDITGVDKFSFIDYIKMDFRTYYKYIANKESFTDDLMKRLVSPIRVMMSHETVMVKNKQQLTPIMKNLRPQLIFSGHWHKSMVYLCEDCLDDNEHHWSVRERDTTWMEGYMKANLSVGKTGKALIEVMVPTCSYRMGVGNIGYGVAVIESTGEMKYTVLWLPNRYQMVNFYIFAIICVALFNGFVYFAPGLRRRFLWLRNFS